jgi:HTH-type transcriptional regulator / antitoxin HigA
VPSALVGEGGVAARFTQMALKMYREEAREDQNSYMELVQRFPLRPIQSEDGLDEAIQVVNTLLDREELDEGSRDYLDVLGDLIEKYETKHHPLPPVSDAEMLQHLIQTKKVTQSLVAAQTGIAVSTISEILAGKRGLSRNHIAKLSSYFAVAPGVFSFVPK